MDPSLISKFCSITNGSEEEANHYLEAFNGDCDEALKHYFETKDTFTPDNNISKEINNFGLNQNIQEKPKSKSKPGGSSKMATLNSLLDQNESDSDEGQAFYVGGSERGGGGQQVLGPPKKALNSQVKKPLDTFVADLFTSAKGKGAEVLESEHFTEAADNIQKPFCGAGYRLGDNLNGASEMCVEEGPSNSNSCCNKKTEKSIAVKMWRDGFSLDNGPLRSYTDPDADEFFNAIKAGRIPQELIRSANGQMVALMLEDHHHEDWCLLSSPKLVPFSGTGQILGFPTPHMDINSSTASKIIQSADTKVEVDESKPVTQLQIRLPDGGRLVVHLNHDHNVGDIRRSILCQRPDLSLRMFNLVTSYPNRELTDNSQTLKEANLLNSALLIRFV